MIDLDAASVMLQWSTGGLLFFWVTARRRLVSAGYGWLLRGLYALVSLVGFLIGVAVVETVPAREAASVGVAAASLVALGTSVRFRTRPELLPVGVDLVAPAVGVVGVVAAASAAGGPPALATARMLAGAAFLGAVSDAMLLGHWYLVQPGLPRAPLLELVRWAGMAWPVEVALLLWPTGMVSVLTGEIDDGYNGLLGWFWAASAATTFGLILVTRLALRERQYSAVMAATGLLYLAILTAFATDLVARALLR